MFFAIFFTIATAYKRVEVFDKTEIDNLSCGWPMRYISSGYVDSALNPPYPWMASCADLLGHGYGDFFDLRWVYFIFDAVFFYSFLFVILNVGRMTIKKHRRKK
ncbi:MAG: hypothetical protein WC178_00680 [Candidatus Paceibacterota bacterium]